MASKKYLLLAGLFALLSVPNLVNAQNSGVYNLTSYDFTDSSLIPEGRMDQQGDFMKNRYLYPAKPRNQWEIGVNVGALNVSGDVRSKTFINQPMPGATPLGFGLTVRKALGYVLSARLQYMMGTAQGYNWQQAIGYRSHGNNPWTQAGYNGPVNYNYKTKVNELTLDMVAALNNIKFHRGQNKSNVYGLFGIGGLLYETTINALNGAARYDFSSVAAVTTTDQPNWRDEYKARKDKNSALLNLLDDDFETRAERHNNRAFFGDEKTFRPVANVGLGMQFRLGKSLALTIEDKVTYTMDDLVDGQRWQEHGAPASTAMTRDFDNINYLSIGLAANLGGDAVKPLWWMNPNDFMYNGLANMTAPTNKCDADKDGDGVSDCYDRCGDTPGGVAVDTHGCPLDTDGDGVADYKDKQLITPTECQPSDADGIGKCPCPDGCVGDTPPPLGCKGVNGGSIMFNGGSRSLSSTAMGQLNSLASQMRDNPNCKVVIRGNGSDSKIAQQRSWDRVNGVINYMVDRNGIDRGRFIFQYGGNGNANAVEYRSAGNGESGPSNAPPPFPNLKR